METVKLPPKIDILGSLMSDLSDTTVDLTNDEAEAAAALAATAEAASEAAAAAECTSTAPKIIKLLRVAERMTDLLQDAPTTHEAERAANNALGG